MRSWTVGKRKSAKGRTRASKKFVLKYSFCTCALGQLGNGKLQNEETMLQQLLNDSGYKQRQAVLGRPPPLSVSQFIQRCVCICVFVVCACVGSCGCVDV